jgi:hypothetical protein|tara:strand:+ start:25 stop:348 length:324 start_codon:yes stop_codon:yes gene_type:complete
MRGIVCQDERTAGPPSAPSWPGGEIVKEDLTFKLLANPTRLKKPNKKKTPNEDDELFLKIKKRYPGMLVFQSDKSFVLNQIESLLIELTISNIVENLVREIEYELLP